MRASTVAAVSVAVVGLVAAVWLGWQWREEQAARKACEASLRETAWHRKDAESKHDDLARSLEQERDARQRHQEELRQVRLEHSALVKERDELAGQVAKAAQVEDALARAAQWEQTARQCQASLESQTAETAARQEALDLAARQAQQRLDGLQRQLELRLGGSQGMTRDAGSDAAQAVHVDAELRAGRPEAAVEISRQGQGVQVTMLGEVLFSSGSRTLRPQGRALLANMAQALADLPGDAVIQVIGHTDATPIQPGMRWLFPSNLELSVARAAAVARVLPHLAGLDPSRFYALGRAEHDPVADNDCPQGRALNRRVVIRILQGEEARQWLGGDGA